MADQRSTDEQLRILAFWWMLEMFSPQSIPKVTPRASRPADRQVIDWRPGRPLPWNELAPPKPKHGTVRVWRHTVYLGIYELEKTYESLHRVFGDDADAYDERPGGESACAGLMIDHDGRVIGSSAVLSSALWAVARIHDPGPRDPLWVDGFDVASRQFVEVVDDHEGDRRDAAGEDRPPPCDEESLHHLLAMAHATAGIAGFAGLATERVRIKSVVVRAQGSDEPPETDFLNSFYLDDLAGVRAQVARGEVGPALAAYLTSEAALRTGDRIDVVHRPGEVSARATIEHLPKGRWPANPKHPLALSQQFAVNEALNTLAPTAGLMGVNGPPGTGKTTMLRDLLAGNVVERARRLAALEDAADAFTDTMHRWTGEGGYPRIVRQLRPELTGFEMVVASANNGAVENITEEIPARRAIDDTWHDRADYFGAIATEILAKAGASDGPDSRHPPVAWGLVAARLGRKSNRVEFRGEFWFDEKDPATNQPVKDGIPRMQTVLQQWRDGQSPRRTWAAARNDFATAESVVDALIEERRRAQQRLGRLLELVEQEGALCEIVARCRRQVEELTTDAARHELIVREAEATRARAVQQHDRQLAAKPGALETIFTLGRAIREWRRGLSPVADTLSAAEARHQEVAHHARQLDAAVQEARARLSAADLDLEHTRQELGTLRTECARDEERYGAGYPGAEWTGDRRELHAPWLDAALDTARSELFLAALDLHRDFLAATASDMLDGLRAASEVVAGIYPPHLGADKLRAAWQLFFLAVPMVSTTFASASRMFGDIGREAIGWLLIDEAGQAAPQYAAGAIWRARRVVAVGDPLQLEPVVTIPQKARRDIAASYGVSTTWIPPRSSVQTLVDRVARFGTTLAQGEDRVWVSAPLRVHRRCDEPMFTLCNRIAYNGIMVNGVHRDLGQPDRFDGTDRSAPTIAASHWVDEPATTPGTHLQPNQIERLEKALAYLHGRGVGAAEIIAISPFRSVADRLAALAMDYPGLRAGTIHTAQGREAPVVILVLGGDPDSPGAKAWAASTPNLVNVAASRAQRRLYVIGDRAAWAAHNYFRQLSDELAVPRPGREAPGL